MIISNLANNERTPRLSISLRPRFDAQPLDAAQAARTINLEVRKVRQFPASAHPVTELSSSSATTHEVAAHDLDAGEILITRGITFRNSTFGALKVFQREYRGRTGVVLTNAAAVDMLLRERLAYCINSRAVGEMLLLSRPGGAQVLQSVEDQPKADAGAPVASAA